METEFRNYWGRITFLTKLWGPVRFQCEDFNARITLFESSKPYRFFGLMSLSHYPGQFVHLSIYSLTMILTMFVWVFVFLCSVFILSVLMSLETVLDFCSLMTYCSFLVFSDSWLRTSLTTSWKWFCCRASANATAFLIAMLLVLINCWVRVVSVSSVFSFSTFDNDFKLIMITIVLLLRPSPVC